MPAASENGQLYRDSQSLVSPSWLVNGKSRYAVRTVVKLEFHTVIQPRARAGFMLLLGIMLSLVSVRYILIDAQPYLVPIIMLTGSITLMAGGACVLYLARPHYRIDMTLLDGSCVSLRRSKRVDAEGLLAGLSAAMDWHRCADPEIQNLPRTGRLRHGIARAPDRKNTNTQGYPTSKPPIPRPSAGPVVATEPASVKRQFAPLLSLLSARRFRRPVD